MGKESEETFFQRRYTSGQQALKRFSILLIIQFSCSVVSDSLRPHGWQHTRPPCPSPTPGVHPNPCPLSRWCHPTISSSVIPFFSCSKSFPALGSFQMSQLFPSGGQNIGVSASTSVLPMNTQDWSPLELTGLIFLHFKGPSRAFYDTTVQSVNSSALSLLYGPIPRMTTGNTKGLTRWTLVGKLMPTLFNALSWS